MGKYTGVPPGGLGRSSARIYSPCGVLHIAISPTCMRALGRERDGGVGPILLPPWGYLGFTRARGELLHIA